MDEKKKKRMIDDEALDRVTGGDDDTEVMYLYRCTECGTDFAALIAPDKCPNRTCTSTTFIRFIGDNDKI